MPAMQVLQNIMALDNNMNKIKIILALLITVVAIGIAYFFITHRNNTPVSTQTAKQTAGWKTYSNNDYSFRIDYPSRFSVVENTKREDYYDTLATFLSQSKESITIRAIHGIDIYKNQKPEDVAKREIVDSGFKYSVIGVKTGNYSAAITTVDNNPDKKYPIITIAHPSKNLFIILEINIPVNAFQGESDKILSSFKFLDGSNNATGNTDNYNKAVKILQAIPEIQIVENAVIKNGRTTSFSSAGGEHGDIVTVLLFEEGFSDQISRWRDSFMVNIKTNEIKVYTDASVPNKNISLDEWKRTVKTRF